MITSADLRKSREVIASQFITQCNSGPQISGMPSTDAACGQFLGDATSAQRGVHGTAAALRVLAEDGRPEARNLIPRLIRYVEERHKIELADAQNNHAASL